MTLPEKLHAMLSAVGEVADPLFVALVESALALNDTQPKHDALVRLDRELDRETQGDTQ